MELSSGTVSAVERALPRAERASILILGSPALAARLRPAHPGLLLAVEDRLPASKLAREAGGVPSVLRAEPLRLPLLERSLDSLVAVDVLSRYATPELVLEGWSRMLKPGGRLIVVEQLVQSATLRALQRLIAPSRLQIPPESLTCLLLNAGYVEIGQSWPDEARGRTVVTCGSLAEL